MSPKLMSTSPTKKKNSCGFEPFAIGLAVVVILGLSGCASGPDRNAPPAISDLPSFNWIASSGTPRSSRSFQGQPVVMIVANRPDQGSVRGQAKRLERQYRDFAGLQTVFIAAMTEQGGRIESNIPFAYAADPLGLANQLGATGDFTLYVVAKDGSVIEQTNKVLSGQRVLDLIVNSRPQQRLENR